MDDPLTRRDLVRRAVAGAQVLSGTGFAAAGGSDMLTSLSWFNVKAPPFDAVADGHADDTASIRHAIAAAARAGGGVVLFPAGRYRVTSSITVASDILLQGVGHNGLAYHDDPVLPVGKGSWLYIETGVEDPDGRPALLLEDNVSLQGLSFYYPAQLAGVAKVGRVVPYSPAVGLQRTIRNSPVIEHCTFHNVYTALDLRGAQRPTVSDVGVGALAYGLRLDGCRDVASICRVHCWPFYQPNGSDGVLRAFAKQHLVAFDLGGVDALQMERVSVVGARYGFRCSRGEPQGLTCWGRIQNFDLDQVAVPIDIESGSGFQIAFINGVLVCGNDYAPAVGDFAVRANGEGHTYLSGLRFVEFPGKSVRTVVEVNSGYVQVDNCYLWAGGTDDDTRPASHVRISGGIVQVSNLVCRASGQGKTIAFWCRGGVASLSNCVTQFANTDLQVDGASANVVVTGCQFLSGDVSVRHTAGELLLGPNRLAGLVETATHLVRG